MKVLNYYQSPEAEVIIPSLEDCILSVNPGNTPKGPSDGDTEGWEWE